jgi:hypothetical protein
MDNYEGQLTRVVIVVVDVVEGRCAQILKTTKDSATATVGSRISKRSARPRLEPRAAGRREVLDEVRIFLPMPLLVPLRGLTTV